MTHYTIYPSIFARQTVLESLPAPRSDQRKTSNAEVNKMYITTFALAQYVAKHAGPHVRSKHKRAPNGNIKHASNIQMQNPAA